MSESGGYEAPLFTAAEPQSECDYLIYTRYHADDVPTFPNVADILVRHGIDASTGYAVHELVVGARLDAVQLAVIRSDRQVEYVERDWVGRAARYFRNLGPTRISDSYIVACVEGSDAGALVARHRVEAARIYPTGDHFSAEMSQDQLQQLRCDRQVEYVQDNAWEGVGGEDPE